jgi:hypothetical protein
MAVHAAELSTRRGTRNVGACAIVLGIGLLVGVPHGAFGQERRGTEAQRQACTPDVYRLCSAQIPDENAIVACMRRERRHLSGGCRTALAQRPTKVAARPGRRRAEGER